MSKIQTALSRAKGDRRNPQKADRRKPQSYTTPPQTDAQGSPIPPRPGILSVASLPRVKVNKGTFRANRLLTHDSVPAHPAQASYRMLRTRLMHSMRSNGWRVLGVSSMGQNEGKTYTSINLAISIVAEIGQEALLVDLDLQRPSVHEYLGINPRQFRSLRNYLEAGTAQLHQILVSPGIEQLGLLLSAPSLQRSSDLLASTRGKELFADLRALPLQDLSEAEYGEETGRE